MHSIKISFYHHSFGQTLNISHECLHKNTTTVSWVGKTLDQKLQICAEAKFGIILNKSPNEICIH